jgi:hypothetical protein
MTVVAALDNSVAAAPVLDAARAFAALLGTDVGALHVHVDGTRTITELTEASGVPLRIVEGEVVDALRHAAADDAVAALVIGARATPGSTRPVGTTALDVLRAAEKAVVIVPPDAARVRRLHRILVPLEGTISSSLAPRAVFRLARDVDIDVVVVHVRDERSLPAFTDQPQHETRAWTEEFLARYCPWGIGDVRVDVRVGRRDEQILAAVSANDVDLIALGWSQQLAAGRAPVVRAVLERAHVPVLLIPVHLSALRADEAERRRSVHSSG